MTIVAAKSARLIQIRLEAQKMRFLAGSRGRARQRLMVIRDSFRLALSAETKVPKPAPNC
jgi:hypothetical protein